LNWSIPSHIHISLYT